MGATNRTLDAAMVDRVLAHVSSEGKTREIVAPFTGEVLAEVPISTPEDVRAAYARARAAQETWAALPVRERIAPFLRLHDALLDRRQELLDIVQWETGKARRHAYEEVADVAGCTLYYARRAPACWSRSAGRASSRSPPARPSCATPRASSR